ncbi:hypothetical protein AB0Q95_28140 [Streptomyces sp. NPDC059900]|uniref:hypothetical protein n=1 Tax=Streptomyces sp. NPDC059900 TaxID=3155816 RepID=UPI00341F54D3
MLSASTAALCLGGVLAACGGGGGDDGYVATGPVGAGPERAPGQGVSPTGDVELVPLDGESSPSGEGDGDGGKGDSSEPSESGSGDSSGKSAASKAGSGSPDGPDAGESSTGGAKPGRTESSSGSGSAGRPAGGASGSPSAPGGGSSTKPSGPAKLSVGEPERKPADDRWCEKVTVAFRNTGGSPVRSGTVTFETHVIGALGVDWATLESTEKLPAPIAAGKTVKKTWPVCVDAWRVPLGMHVETRDVSVDWK